MYCQTKVFVRADDDLNVAYGRRLGRLSPQAQGTLRAAQRVWLAARNRDCTRQDSNLGTVVSLTCALGRTTSRVNFLNDRYRECLSSGCQPGKLNDF